MQRQNELHSGKTGKAGKRNMVKFIEKTGLALVIIAFAAKIYSRRGHFSNYESGIEYAFLIGMVMWSLAYLMREKGDKKNKNNLIL